MESLPQSTDSDGTMSFSDKAMFEDWYSAAVAESIRVAAIYNVGSDHVTIVRIISDPNFKDLMRVAWRILQLGPNSLDRKALTCAKVKLLFCCLGIQQYQLLLTYGQ